MKPIVIPAQNISEFEVGEILITKSGNYATILDKTDQSVEVNITIMNRNPQKKGISYSDWYNMDAFNKRFTKLIRSTSL